MNDEFPFGFVENEDGGCILPPADVPALVVAMETCAAQFGLRILRDGQIDADTLRLWSEIHEWLGDSLREAWTNL